jgi:hypothetical protein
LEFPEVIVIRRKWHSLFRRNQHMPASQARSAIDGIDTRELDHHPALVGPDILYLDGVRSLSRILQEHLPESLEAGGRIGQRFGQDFPPAALWTNDASDGKETI